LKDLPYDYPAPPPFSHVQRKESIVTQESAASSTAGFGDAFAKMIVDVMFFGFITMLKVIGCYLYMIIIMSIVSLLTLVGIVLAGLLVGALLGKLAGILVGVLVFGLVLTGPFSKWMSLIKTAAKHEFFGKT
jgi:K+-sensing histidine kinase KdpD